jgi:hypothetical protein
MENITITRISDLPDLGQIQGQQSQGQQVQQGQGQGPYQPMMNVHPNPYGISQPPSGGLPPPVQTQEGPKLNPSIMYNPQTDIQENPTLRLPSRDIPMNMDDFMHDEQIKPNYIPKPKLSRDYIDDYQNSANRKLKEYEDKKRLDKSRETWFDEIRIPVIIGILFFIFNMPIINTLIFKRFTFLSIYNDDGNFNMSGLIFKSTIFGGIFWLLNRSMEYLGEL